MLKVTKDAKVLRWEAVPSPDGTLIAHHDKNLQLWITNPADGDANVALRATYLIDPKGTVRAVTMHDLPVGRSVEETLRTLKAFQVSGNE